MQATLKNEQDLYDVELLTTLLQRGINTDASNKDKEIVLVVGNTGAGKSTTINYLLGSTLQKVMSDTVNGQYTIEVSPIFKEYTEIGKSSMTSHTIFPNCFTSKNGITYCDTPGFSDTRGSEYQLSSALSIRSVINSVRKIKGIILVIDQSSMLKSRARALHEIIDTMHQFIRKDIDLKSLSASITVVATKIKLPNMTRNIFAKIHSEQARRNNNEAKKIVQFLDIVLKGNSNIVEIDPLDNGESKSRIEQHIKDFSGIDKSVFSIPLGRKNIIQLTKYLTTLDEVGHQCLIDVLSLPTQITSQTTMLRQEKDQLVMLGSVLEKMRSENPESKEYEYLSEQEQIELHCVIQHCEQEARTLIEKNKQNSVDMMIQYQQSLDNTKKAFKSRAIEFSGLLHQFGLLKHLSILLPEFDRSYRFKSLLLLDNHADQSVKFITYLTNFAKKGCLDSIYCLAQCYRFGILTKQDHDQAESLFLLVPRSYKKNSKLFEKYDRKTNIFIIVDRLCELEKAGYVKARDRFDKIMFSIKKDARSGNADAQYYVGMFHTLGLGLERNMVFAAMYLQTAASGGNLKAKLRCEELLNNTEPQIETILNRGENKSTFFANTGGSNSSYSDDDSYMDHSFKRFLDL